MSQVNTFFSSFKGFTATVMLFALAFSTAANAGAHKQAEPAPTGDVVEVAVAAGSFNTLVAAIQAADLVGALQGDGPFTVFAPTDAAFAALPEGTVENLLKPENQAQLKAVLLYHVVPGKVMSADLKGTVKAETLQGSTVEIIKSEGWTEKQRGVTVNGANVVSADVAASNGVIHVIDAVLLPPAE